MRKLIFWLSKKKAFTNSIGRAGLRSGFAQRYVAGNGLEDGLRVAKELNDNGFLFHLNHLGEFVESREEVEAAFESYRVMLREIDERKLDGVISIKPTHLGLGIDPQRCRELTGRLAAEAAGRGSKMEVDMENTPYTEATVSLFEDVRKVHSNLTLALQTYLYRTEKDLERLKPLKPKIRLVKGAYLEPPDLAFPKKSQVDENYRKLMRKLFTEGFTPSIATHDPVLIEEAKRLAQENGFRNDQWEFQMILGVQRDMQAQLVKEGYRVRIYIPFGKDWMGYFMRRLAERPANLLFVAKSLFRG